MSDSMINATGKQTRPTPLGQSLIKLGFLNDSIGAAIYELAQINSVLTGEQIPVKEFAPRSLDDLQLAPLAPLPLPFIAEDAVLGFENHLKALDQLCDTLRRQVSIQ